MRVENFPSMCHIFLISRGLQKNSLSRTGPSYKPNSLAETVTQKGPEGVKWELGFAYFCTGKMKFGSLGLGITNTQLGMGNMSFHCTACVINAQ